MIEREPQENRVHLGLLVRAEQREALAALARERDRSVSSVTRAAIDAYLIRERGQPEVALVSANP